MLPEGHTPGDKTLYLLAKLSKEVDGATASRLLSEEVAERCRQNLSLPRNNIVANVDIRNILDRINPNSFANQRSLEPSQRSLSLDQENSSRPPQSVIKSSRVSASLMRSEPTKRPPPDQGQVDSLQKTPRVSKQPESLQDSRSMIRSTGNNSSIPPTRCANIPSTPALTLENLMEELPPINVRFPDPLQSFSLSFLREKIGGGEFAFSKVGSAMLKKQIVSWPEVIRIIPEHQKFAPKLGRHGALAFVDGRPGCGEIGKTYPAVFRQNKERFLYIGHYTLVTKETVSLEEWQTWPEEEKLVIVRDIRDTIWGQDLLHSKDLTTREELAQLDLKEQADEILKLFDLESEPNLRMTWVVLRLDDFRADDYEILKSARAHPEPKSLQQEGDTASERSKVISDPFQEAVGQFLGEKAPFDHTLRRVVDCSAVGLSPKLVGKTVEDVHKICKVDPQKCFFFGKSFNDLDHEVRTRGTDARRFRMDFQPNSLRADRRLDARLLVADWTRDVFANQLHSVDLVLFALHLMLSMYKEQEAQAPRKANDPRESDTSTTRNTLTASTRPLLDPRANRHHDDGSDSDEILYVSSKRRKTASFTARPLRTHDGQHASGIAQASVEINERGSTIFVDSGRRNRAAPTIKRDVEVSEDDLYNATPRPPVRKSVLSKRASGV